MNKEFGTVNLNNYSQKELLLESKKLILSMYYLNNNSLNEYTKYKDVLRLFEIIKFGKDKFPYLLTLEFDKNKDLSKVDMWQDPYFNQNKDISTAFIGNVLGFPDLCTFSKNPKILRNTIDIILLESIKPNSDILEDTVCIAGNNDSILNIGRARKSIFVNENNKPLVSL